MILTAEHGIITYPKIDTVFVRNKDDLKHVHLDQIRRPEFELIPNWIFTEKIDGTNIRIVIQPNGTILFGGRTNNSQIPPNLLSYLVQTFTLDTLRKGLHEQDVPIVLFGEGYGPDVQGGGDYRNNHPSFRLFDINIGGLWLAPDQLSDIATDMGIPEAPTLAIGSISTAFGLLSHRSVVADRDGGKGRQVEGVVARTQYGLLNRLGQRIMWKLKFSDIPEA